jgi:hypothetical protein
MSNKKNKLKTYNKPQLNVFGNLVDITKGGEEGSGDKAGRYGHYS